ncbi:MAG TPA: transcriptional regulator [Anaerolineae bacterium]|nr:transcriptional regulator [Anaerolineae bacterium]
MPELDPIIHQPVRLQIMAALTALPEDAQLNFVTLREMLKLTDGNLSVHLRKLEDAGYIRIDKTFEGRKPRTFIAATPAGRAAFDAHVRALKQILGQSDGTDTTTR